MCVCVCNIFVLHKFATACTNFSIKANSLKVIRRLQRPEMIIFCHWSQLMPLYASSLSMTNQSWSTYVLLWLNSASLLLLMSKLCLSLLFFLLWVNLIFANKYFGPLYCQVEIYAGHVTGCPLVSHSEYADGEDRHQTVTLYFQLNALSVIMGTPSSAFLAICLDFATDYLCCFLFCHFICTLPAVGLAMSVP